MGVKNKILIYSKIIRKFERFKTSNFSFVAGRSGTVAR